MAGVIVLDASVLIAFLDGEDPHHAAAESLFRSAVEDDLGVNSLTLAEVLVAPARDGRLGAVRGALRDLGVDELPFPPDAAQRLARLRVLTGLKMPDCCVLLAVEGTGSSAASFDDRLTRVAEGLGVPVVRA